MKKVSQPAESLSNDLEFKQSVVSEICSGRRVTEVCKSYSLCSGILRIWIKKAYAPNFPYNSSEAWTLNKVSKSLYSK